MLPFVYHRMVQFADTDMAGIIHFANYFRYMEEAEHAYLRSLGLSVMHQQPDGTYLGWPRVRTGCSFEVPAKYQDELEVRIWVSRIGLKSLTFDAECWRGDTRLAKGFIKTVCCRVSEDRQLVSIPIPVEFTSKIVEYQPSPGDGSATDPDER